MLSADKEDIADVRATLSGDAEAYARIVARHAESVQRQMRHFSRHEVDELSHDVFVEVYLSLSRFRGDAPLRHWIARIGTFRGCRHWRMQKSRNAREKSLSDVVIDSAAAEPPREIIDPKIAADLLFELLSLLPEADRLVMTLMYLEKIPQDEIAERLGYSRVGVAVRIHRAKKKLQKIGEKPPWKGRLAWIHS